MYCPVRAHIYYFENLINPADHSCLCVQTQAQHSHHVIQQVLNHLDTHHKGMPRVRAGIVQVLLETVAIAAKGSVGQLLHIRTKNQLQGTDIKLKDHMPTALI